MSLLNGVLAQSRALRALRPWRPHVLCVLTYLACFKFLYTAIEFRNKFPDCPVSFKFSLPVSSNKVKIFLKREGSFDIFIKLYT